MLKFGIICLIFLVSMAPAVGKEVAYAFSKDSGHPIGQGNLTDYNGNDVVSYTISAPPGEALVSQKIKKTEDYFNKDLNEKMNIGSQSVRNEAIRLVGRRSGPQRVDQICSIYDYMVANWTYVSDWRGLEVLQYSNYTLEMGKEVGSSGKGDCDDFAILLAALIDSIGGTPRIILAYGPTGGHAYTEVYLGKMGGQDKNVNRILKWLRSEYKAKEIYGHTDPVSGDVWLNLDWWTDTGGANHPGGPFYQAATQVPITIGDEDKVPVTPIQNLLPYVAFNFTPAEPEVGQMVEFNASQSSDPNPEGKIVDYKWSFGDGGADTRPLCPHIYSSSGTFSVSLTVTNDEGDLNSTTRDLDVIEPPPEAIITYSPAEPKVGDVITFDASKSRDKRGRIIDYEWDFDDGYSGKRISIDHRYLKYGTYNVKLIATNDRSIQNISTISVIVGPNIGKSESEPRTNMMIKFPSNGSVVSTQERMTGIAQNVPVDKEGWLIIFAYSAQRYYPQGPIRPDANGSWSFVSNIGSERDVGRKFDAILLLADNQAKDMFSDYFRNVSLRGWEGMVKLPNHVDEYHRITVIRGEG
jgi:PKD repeat protein